MTGKKAPDLDEFISASRRPSYCVICTGAPTEAKVAIRIKYDAGIKPWTAFCRYLAACGVENVTAAKLQRHLEQGHPDA